LSHLFDYSRPPPQLPKRFQGPLKLGFPHYSLASRLCLFVKFLPKRFFFPSYPFFFPLVAPRTDPTLPFFFFIDLITPQFFSEVLSFLIICLFPYWQAPFPQLPYSVILLSLLPSSLRSRSFPPSYPILSNYLFPCPHAPFQSPMSFSNIVPYRR